jgi:hypothetical protein
MNAVLMFDSNFKNADDLAHLLTLLNHLNLQHLQYRCGQFSTMAQAHLCILGLLPFRHHYTDSY